MLSVNSVELNEVRNLKAAISESEKELEMWRRTATLKVPAQNGLPKTQNPNSRVERFAVVSGGARGIDTFAHIGALQRGRTVAVLGCGINYAFSSGNAKLIREIAENGVVMTEYAPNVQASAKTFPARNRIIAGLSRGIVVVEGAEKSGTSITCDYALKYGRDIFLLNSPHNNIVRQGVIFINDAADVVNFYAERRGINAKKI